MLLKGLSQSSLFAASQFAHQSRLRSAQGGFTKINWIDEIKSRDGLQRCTRCAVTTKACSVHDSRFKLVPINPCQIMHNVDVRCLAPSVLLYKSAVTGDPTC